MSLEQDTSETALVVSCAIWALALQSYRQRTKSTISSHMRGLGRFRNSQQAFAQGVKIPRPFSSLAVRHMAICGKIVDYISGHKQFDVASAISNFKKILSKNISPFGTVKTESENIWSCWRRLYKKQQNKEHKQDAALLIGVNLLQQYHIRKY